MINTQEQLAAFLPVIRSAVWLALDTEADSLHAYPEKVCLIQISTTEGDRLVDPLADLDLTPFLDALAGRELIFHAADYDLRLLRKHHEFTPSVIFDTMLAARLLGERQFGLGSLVEKFLGVKLDKGSQKADWAQRPLTPKMEAYARNDTHHLKPLETRLKAELCAKGRLAWHQESCARLIVDCSRPVVVDQDSVWRIKGSTFLERGALAVLRELWHWREREALAANRPPFFVLNHDRLVAIAVEAVINQQWESFLPNHMSPRRRAALMDAVKAGLAVPAGQQPEIIRHKFVRPGEAERHRFNDLIKRRDAHAHKLGIDSSIIAGKSIIGDLARDWDRHAPELMSWQRELLK